MKASKSGSPDEIRERFLGEIAPFLAAAGNIESLSPAQKQQVRKRISRTLFRFHSLHVRFRLAPVFVGVGLLVAGGVAFATAERLGLIRRIDQGPPSSLAKATSDAHKRRTAHPRHAVQQDGLLAEDAAEDAAKVEASIALPEVPDPLLSAPTTASTLVWSPIVQGRRPTSVQPANPAAFWKPSYAPRIARTPVPSFAKNLSQPARTVALATPYLAEPAPPTTQPRAPLFAPSVPVPAALPARQDVVPHADAPSLAPAAPAKVEPEKRLPSDAVLFGQALRKLRNENNPTAALSALQEHAQAYPRSAISGERNALEVEALLALHRDREALQKLDGMALEELPRSGERFVVRGELRAAARRWQEAKADFDHALSRVSGSPAWHERALWGRGVAYLRCGEQEPGMADIERYRDLYPKGRFAAEASRFFTRR
jgi:hypothetical protein